MILGDSSRPLCFKFVSQFYIKNCKYIGAYSDQKWIFYIYSKIWSKTLYYSTGCLAKFRQKWLGENSPFL